MDTSGFLTRAAEVISWHDLLLGMAPGLVIVLFGAGYLWWEDWREARNARIGDETKPDEDDISHVGDLLDLALKNGARHVPLEPPLPTVEGAVGPTVAGGQPGTEGRLVDRPVDRNDVARDEVVE